MISLSNDGKVFTIRKLVIDQQYYLKLFCLIQIHRSVQPNILLLLSDVKTTELILFKI